MENQDLDIPLGYEHLFPGPPERQRGKKRSSILKQLDANTDYCRDDRRSMKRVSFAQHTVYQEVFPDGTISCIEKQLKAERITATIQQTSNGVVDRGSNDENMCPNFTSCEQVVSESEIITNVNESKILLPKVNLNESKVDTARKQKVKTAFINHMERNYNINDDKDYDTLYNTSVNKFGREILPREERPNVTKLFQDAESQMQLDATSISVTGNVSKAFSVEDSGTRMSLVEETKSIVSECGTKIFSSDIMDVSSQDDFKSVGTRAETSSSDISSNEFVSMHNTTFLQTEHLSLLSNDDIISEAAQAEAETPPKTVGSSEVSSEELPRKSINPALIKCAERNSMEPRNFAPVEMSTSTNALSSQEARVEKIENVDSNKISNENAFSSHEPTTENFHNLLGTQVEVCAVKKSAENIQSIKSVEMSTATPPSSQESVVLTQSSQDMERDVDDMDCSSGEDTDTCSESLIESDESTNRFDETMDVCSSENEISEEIKGSVIVGGIEVKDINGPTIITEHNTTNSEFESCLVHAAERENVVETKEIALAVNADVNMTTKKKQSLGNESIVNAVHNVIENIHEVLSNESSASENLFTEDASLKSEVVIEPINHAEVYEEVSTVNTENKNISVEGEEALNATENIKASKGVSAEATIHFGNESQTTNSIFKTQSLSINILSKIKLPTAQFTSFSQPETSSLNVTSKIPVPQTRSFLLPSEVIPPKPSFCFQQKRFPRVSCLPKATINSGLQSRKVAVVDNENIDTQIETDWEKTDYHQTQQNECRASDISSLRPRLRRSFGLSIQQKLQKKIEEIENKRKTIAIAHNESKMCTDFDQSNIVSKAAKSESCVINENIVNTPDGSKTESNMLQGDNIDVDSGSASTVQSKNSTNIIENVTNQSASNVNNCSYSNEKNTCENFDLANKLECIAQEELSNSFKRKHDSIEETEDECSISKQAKGIEESIHEVAAAPNSTSEADEIGATVNESLHDELSGSTFATKSRLLIESSFMLDSEEDSSDTLYDVCEKDSIMNSSMNPFQFSFINKEDTLFLMAEELEQTFDEVTFSSKTSVFSKSSIQRKYPECCASLERLKSEWLSEYNVHIGEVDEKKLTVAFMNGLFVLELHFDQSNSTVKSVTNLKMSFHYDSEIEADGFFLLRDDFMFQLTSKHKGLMIPINFMVASKFEEIKDALRQKYSTESLDELIKEVAEVMISSEQLLMELRSQSAFHKFLFRKMDDHFEFVFMIRGLGRNIYLVLPIDVKYYPFVTVTPKFGVHATERHRYCLKAFVQALKEVPTGAFYITRLIKSAKICVRAMKKVELENKKANKQRIRQRT